MGGYCSSGCAGALPLGRHELKTNTSLKSSHFFQSLSVSLLHAMEEKGGQCGGRVGQEVGMLLSSAHLQSLPSFIPRLATPPYPPTSAPPLAAG